MPFRYGSTLATPIMQATADRDRVQRIAAEQVMRGQRPDINSVMHEDFVRRTDLPVQPTYAEDYLVDMAGLGAPALVGLLVRKFGPKVAGGILKRLPGTLRLGDDAIDAMLRREGDKAAELAKQAYPNPNMGVAREFDVYPKHTPEQVRQAEELKNRFMQQIMQPESQAQRMAGPTASDKIQEEFLKRYNIK